MRNEVAAPTPSAATPPDAVADAVAGAVPDAGPTAAPTNAAEQLSAHELGAWRGFLRVHAQVARRLDAELVAAHGLPLTSYEVLLSLAEQPDGCMRMSELADSVLLSRSGLTRLVDRLERDGLLSRQACPNDARGQFAAITARGRERFSEARGTHLAGIRARFLEHLNDEERRILSTLWERIVPGAVSSPAGGCRGVV